MTCAAQEASCCGAFYQKPLLPCLDILIITPRASFCAYSFSCRTQSVPAGVFLSAPGVFPYAPALPAAWRACASGGAHLLDGAFVFLDWYRCSAEDLDHAAWKPSSGILIGPLPFAAFGIGTDGTFHGLFLRKLLLRGLYLHLAYPDICFDGPLVKFPEFLLGRNLSGSSTVDSRVIIVVCPVFPL